MSETSKMIDQNITRSAWQSSIMGFAHMVGIPFLSGNCLALYTGANSRWDMKMCFEILCQEFCRLGKEPDLIGLDEMSNRMIHFESGLKKLQHFDWLTLDCLTLKATRPIGGFNSGWYISAGFSRQIDYIGFAFGDDVAPFDKQYFTSLAKRILVAIDFNYGIAYSRRINLGPDIYAVGMNTGLGHSSLEKIKIAKWFNAEICFKERLDSRSNYLRDVYELNFLSSVHLSQSVNGDLLSRWIERDPAHGKLESLTKDRWVWSIDKNMISSIREVLRTNSLLVAYMNDIPPR